MSAWPSKNYQFLLFHNVWGDISFNLVNIIEQSYFVCTVHSLVFNFVSCLTRAAVLF